MDLALRLKAMDNASFYGFRLDDDKLDTITEMEKVQVCGSGKGTASVFSSLKRMRQCLRYWHYY